MIKFIGTIFLEGIGVVDAYKEYWLPTLLVAVAVALDLFVNRQLKKKDLMPCIIAIPREILLLSMGFVITYTASSEDVQHATTGTVMIVISFFLSLLIYATCRYSSEYHSDLANTNVTFKSYLPLVGTLSFAWIASIVFYFYSVILCLGGKTS